MVLGFGGWWGFGAFKLCCLGSFGLQAGFKALGNATASGLRRTNTLAHVRKKLAPQCLDGAS